ncbi:hypothetical protein [Polaromonas vacuolata]|nr:hypothetical protein [Polaromonas vacuolata]
MNHPADGGGRLTTASRQTLGGWPKPGCATNASEVAESTNDFP